MLLTDSLPPPTPTRLQAHHYGVLLSLPHSHWATLCAPLPSIHSSTHFLFRIPSRPRTYERFRALGPLPTCSLLLRTTYSLPYLTFSLVFWFDTSIISPLSRTRSTNPARPPLRFRSCRFSSAPIATPLGERKTDPETTINKQLLWGPTGRLNRQRLAPKPD